MKARGIHNTFHVSLRKQFVEDTFTGDPAPAPAILLKVGHEDHEVEAILSHRKRRGKTKYLVKLKGHADHENTWQSAKDSENANDLLQEYRASNRCLSAEGGMWRPVPYATRQTSLRLSISRHFQTNLS